jgi:hypothetical protein
MKKNYLYNLVLSITNILFPILSFPYASRILGPAGIGKVQLSVTFAQYFGLIAALGIPIYGIQEIARYRHDKDKLSKVFSELVSIYFITSVVVAIIYLILISTVPIFKINYGTYLYSGLIVLLGFTTLDWVYSGLEEYKIITIRSVVIKAIGLLLLYLFVNSKVDIMPFLLITIFSMMGNNLISLYYIRKRTNLIISGMELKRHLKPLFYIFATTMAASMYTYLDTILLGLLSNETSVGYYTASIKLTKIAIPFITAAGFVFIPKFAIQTSNNNKVAVQELLNKSWHYIVFFSVPISVGLFVLAKEFIIVFSGKAFEQAFPTMQLLSPLPFLIGLGYFFAFQVMVPMGKNKEMFFSVMIGMVISLILNFVLIPILRENGSAITSVITELVVSLMYLYYVNRLLNYKYQWKLVVNALISSLLFLPIAYLLRSLLTSETLVLLMGIVGCAICYFCIQYYFYKDIFVKQILAYTINKFTNANK